MWRHNNSRRFPSSGGGNTGPKPKPVKLPEQVGKPVKLPEQVGKPVKPSRPRPGKPVKMPKPSRPVTGADLANAAKPGGPSVRPKPKPKPRPKPKPSHKHPAPNRVVNRHGVQSSTRAASGAAGGGSAGKPRKPKTFKHPDGSIRPYLGRGAKPGGGRNAKPAKDPLEALVDEIIASRTQPLEEQRRQTTEQSIGNITQNNRLGQMYHEQVGDIRQDANLDLGAALNKAAELRGISQETIAANQEWLKSLMGPTAGGTGDAQVAEAGAENLGAVGASADAMAQEIASRGQSLNNYMGQQQVIGRTQQREMNQQELLRRSAAHREIDGQIAGQKGQRAEMLHGMRAAERDQALKEAVAQQEWGLKASQLELQAQRAAQQAAYQAGQLQLGADRNKIAAHNATKPKDPKAPADSELPGKYGNVPKKYDSAIDKAYSEIFAGMNVKDNPKTPEVEKPTVRKPWRDGHRRLLDIGLDPTAAAFIVTKWFPESITRSNPYNIRRMLTNRGVSLGAQRRIITQFFGVQGWKSSTQKPKREGFIGGAFDQIEEGLR